MNRVNQLASVLTIAVATFGAGSAFADCAADLAAMRAELNLTSSTAGTPPEGGEAMSADGAGTASVGSSAATAGSAADTAPSTGGATTSASPEAKDQAAAATGGETYTQSQAATANPGQAPDATGQVSGVAPTAAVGQVAAGGTATGGGAAAAAASGGANAATTTPGAAATGESGNQMVMTHLAEAQTALDGRDEAACLQALESAKGAM